MNGKPGDDPITDVVKYRLAVFAPAVDILIAEIVALGGEQELRERGLDGLRPVPSNLQQELRQVRDRRVREGQKSGWEVGRLFPRHMKVGAPCELFEASWSDVFCHATAAYDLTPLVWADRNRIRRTLRVNR